MFIERKIGYTASFTLTTPKGPWSKPGFDPIPNSLLIVKGISLHVLMSKM
jgi:hypothetical protein